jgi:hypothetical protein
MNCCVIPDLDKLMMLSAVAVAIPVLLYILWRFR